MSHILYKPPLLGMNVPLTQPSLGLRKLGHSKGCELSYLVPIKLIAWYTADKRVPICRYWRWRFTNMDVQSIYHSKGRKRSQDCLLDSFPCERKPMLFFLCWCAHPAINELSISSNHWYCDWNWQWWPMYQVWQLFPYWPGSRRSQVLCKKSFFWFWITQ